MCWILGTLWIHHKHDIVAEAIFINTEIQSKKNTKTKIREKLKCRKKCKTRPRQSVPNSLCKVKIINWNKREKRDETRRNRKKREETEQDQRSTPWSGDLDFDFDFNCCIFEVFFIVFFCSHILRGSDQKNPHFFRAVYWGGSWTRTRPGNLVMPGPFGWLFSQD